MQFSASISSGSSGGALFNDKGEVIGITSASFVDGQNMNLAIPAEEIEKISRDGSMTVEELLYSNYENIKAVYDAQPVDFSLLYKDTQEYNGKVISTQGTVAFVEDQGDTLLIGVTDNYENRILSNDGIRALYDKYSTVDKIPQFCKDIGFAISHVALITIEENDIWCTGDIIAGEEVEICGIFHCDFVGHNTRYDWPIRSTLGSLATIDGYCLMKVE